MGKVIPFPTRPKPPADPWVKPKEESVLVSIVGGILWCAVVFGLLPAVIYILHWGNQIAPQQHRDPQQQLDE